MVQPPASLALLYGCSGVWTRYDCGTLGLHGAHVVVAMQILEEGAASWDERAGAGASRFLAAVENLGYLSLFSPHEEVHGEARR